MRSAIFKLIIVTTATYARIIGSSGHNVVKIVFRPIIIHYEGTIHIQNNCKILKYLYCVMPAHAPHKLKLK